MKKQVLLYEPKTALESMKTGDAKLLETVTVNRRTQNPWDIASSLK